MSIAVLQLECGRALQEQSGTFSSPAFPKSQKHKLCEWRIAETPGERIFLNFTVFGLRRSSSRCRDEHAEVRDGYSKSSPLIGRFCGRKVPPSIWSTGNRLWIKYQSYEVVGKQGFKANYKGEKKKFVREIEETWPVATWRLQEKLNMETML